MALKNKNRADRIRELLEEAFSPESLVIHNESHLHQNHPGSPNTGDSHFQVVITDEKFDNMSRVDAHRLINRALAGEFDTGLHALSVKFDMKK